ncbi:MAG: hypothetical protein MUC77_00385 [Chromatiaceae bacterium]|jgi:hypothetical protein|nr:hypothetical protein [Chromatiaceae bacterium]
MKAVLAVLVLALIGVLTWQWTTWTPEVNDSANALGGAVEPGARVEDDNPLARLKPLADREEYQVVVDRPLFSPTRRPLEDEPEQVEPEVAADGSLDRIDLNAVLITPDETLAWVMDASSREVRRLRLGDELEGWAVRDILSDRLVLERQGQTNTLVLRDYARQPPPPVRPRPPPVRPPARNQPTPPRPAPPAGNPQAQEDATPPESTPPP